MNNNGVLFLKRLKMLWRRITTTILSIQNPGKKLQMCQKNVKIWSNCSEIHSVLIKENVGVPVRQFNTLMRPRNGRLSVTPTTVIPVRNVKFGWFIGPRPSKSETEGIIWELTWGVILSIVMVSVWIATGYMRLELFDPETGSFKPRLVYFEDDEAMEKQKESVERQKEKICKEIFDLKKKSSDEK